MENGERAMRLLPVHLRERAGKAEPEWEELRLRLGRAVSACAAGRERLLPTAAVTQEDISYVLERASGTSFQTVESQLRSGFVMAAGGIRIGVCGTAVLCDGRVEGVRDFTSLCLRIPHEKRGCADGIYPALTDGGFVSTLIYSPPGAGKTTLLRELVRRLSDGGYRVAVADERGEIAGMPETGAGFALGAHTDVMTALPKARAVMQLTRTMDPQIVAMDEITENADASSLLSAAGCGVALLASVHVGGWNDLRRRPVMRRMLDAGVFEKAVGIACRGAERVYEVTAL